MGVFGDKLRNRREQRGISLDAISTTTKISLRMLRAIEDEHFEQLPGGVFNKGFVRAYARQIGLDEEETISDYLAALRESQIQSQTVPPSFRNSHNNPATEIEETESTRRNPIDPRNLGGKRAAGHDHGNANLHSNTLENDPAADSDPNRRARTNDRRREARRSKDRDVHPDGVRPDDFRSAEARSHADAHEENLDDSAAAPPLSFLNLTSAPSSSQLPPDDHPEPIAASAPIAAPNSSRRVPWEKLAGALLLITLTLALWTLHRRSHATAVPQAAAPTPASAVSPESSTANIPLVAKNSPPPLASLNHPATIPADPDVNPPVAKPKAPIIAPKPPTTFTLLIRADQTSWVAISADGQATAKETLIAPANTSVRAHQEIVVRVGNAAGISFLLNGKEIPTHGNPGEVRTYTFNATGMLASDAAQSTNTTR